MKKKTLKKEIVYILTAAFIKASNDNYYPEKLADQILSLFPKTLRTEKMALKKEIKELKEKIAAMEYDNLEERP